jgi:hypothetical protein
MPVFQLLTAQASMPTQSQDWPSPDVGFASKRLQVALKLSMKARN